MARIPKVPPPPKAPSRGAKAPPAAKRSTRQPSTLAEARRLLARLEAGVVSATKARDRARALVAEMERRLL